jgi:CelD/BcsL family acetyltransferase involved in cellulose biosynthesis
MTLNRSATIDAPRVHDIAGPFEAGVCHAEVQASVLGLGRDWEALERDAANATVFQSLTWCGAWLEAAARAGLAEELRLVTVRAGGRVALLWPLAVRRTATCRVLHALAEPATQYCDALVAGDDSDKARLLDAAWALIKSWKDIDLVELRRVRDDAAIASLPVIAAGRGIIDNLVAAPFVDIRLATGAGHRSSKTRNALRRHERKLAEHGPVRFEVIEEHDNKIKIMSEAIAFKRRWMEARGLWSSGYAHGASNAFTSPLARSEQFLVARLAVGDTTAAVEAGFVIGDRYWSLTQSYNERFACHAPGRLLMWHFIDHCATRGIDWLDFLAPAHGYKRDWATGEMPVRDHLIPLSTKGLVWARALKFGRPALKRVFGVLPATMQRCVKKLLAAT